MSQLLRKEGRNERCESETYLQLSHVLSPVPWGASLTLGATDVVGTLGPVAGIGNMCDVRGTGGSIDELFGNKFTVPLRGNGMRPFISTLSSCCCPWSWASRTHLCRCYRRLVCGPRLGGLDSLAPLAKKLDFGLRHIPFCFKLHRIRGAMPFNCPVRPPIHSCYAELSLHLRLDLQPRCSACFVTMITILVDRSRAISCRLPWLQPWWSGIDIGSTLSKKSVPR